MKEKICFYVHTEYHLLLSLHAISTKYCDTERFEIHLFINRNPNGVRLNQELDFSGLPYKIHFLSFPKHLTRKLTDSERAVLDDIMKLQLTEFNFFQEQDTVAVILINSLKKNGTIINLYQDGLKPYIAHTMKFSPGLVLGNIIQNKWIRKNGYPVPDRWSFVNCKLYGFLKGIDSLYLTFPDAYINWKRLPLTQISPEFSSDFTNLLKKVYMWDDSLLQEREGVIFFLNQPMHDDGSFDVNFLTRLKNLHPNSQIYIKNHPNTPPSKVDLYRQFDNVTIIDSKIPAELFISQLRDSIVISLCSTSMFINNPACKFYYTFGVSENNNIERLNKYMVINPTKHVVTCRTFEEVKF